MMQNFCEFAPDYRELLRSLDDATAMQEADRVIQMPYAATVRFHFFHTASCKH